MSKSKEWQALIKSRNLTDADAEKLLAEETKQIADSLKALPPEIFQAQLQVAKVEEIRRADQDAKAFNKRATENPAEVAKEIRDTLNFDPGWR